MTRTSTLRSLIETITGVVGCCRGLPPLTTPPGFNWFLASTFASAIGRNGYLIACAWLLATHNSGSAPVAVLFAIISVTELLGSPLAGWMTDRWDRRHLSVIADGTRFVALLSLGAVLIDVDLRWMIWISAVLFAFCDRIVLTASQSMIPSVADRLSPSTANSVVFFLMQSGSLVAAALTGVLLHYASPAYTFSTLAIAFAVSGGLMLAVRRNDDTSPPERTKQRTKLVIDTAIVQLGAIYALLYTGGVLVSVIAPSYIFDELGGTAIEFGKLESAWSAGSIVGALLLIPLVRTMPIPPLQLATLGATAVCFGTLKLLDLPWTLLIFALLGGLYNLGRVAVEVRLQFFVPASALGRAKGVLHSVAVLFGVIVLGVIALSAEEMSPSGVFLAYALVLAAGTLALGLLRRFPCTF